MVRAGRSDILLALFVLAISAMLLIPLPTSLLDILLVINISFAVLLLLVALYMPNALALLAFPSLLLLTTLFRLGLNVASTRLILMQGYAGEVIQSFGQFLVRGEIVVGLVIFTIITLVNFIVIARGSARVSEVTARFALDSLPGKQMAIDSDLRSGLLSAEEASRKREELRKESQLYGSMDGAMRFVQGDAVAGLFVIVVNIVGGVYMGLMSGSTFVEALSNYTILTVGDGLVNQIPALLISICAGMVVTRVSAEENSTLGHDLGAQLFARPTVLVFAGVVMLFIGLLPGLPILPFWSIGLLLSVTGIYLMRENTPKGVTEIITNSALPLDRLPEPLLLGLEDRGVQVQLNAAVLYSAFEGHEQAFRTWWNEFARDFYTDVGLKLPNVRFRPDQHQSSSSYQISFGDTVIESGTLPLDARLIELAATQAEMLGLAVLQEEKHPLWGSSIVWAKKSPDLDSILENADLRYYEFPEFIGLRIARYFRRFPEELITLSEVHAFLKNLDKRYPGLIEEVFNKGFINATRFTETLQELVRQGISIKDYKQILELCASYCSLNGAGHLAADDFDLQDLVGFIRTAKGRVWIGTLLGERRTLRVVTLSDKIEETLESVAGKTQNLSLSESDGLEHLRQTFESVINPVIKRGLPPFGFLCKAELRVPLLAFLRSVDCVFKVVTFEDLEPTLKIEKLAVWS